MTIADAIRPNARELQAMTLFCLSQFRATTYRNIICNYLVTSPLSVAPSREKNHQMNVAVLSQNCPSTASSQSQSVRKAGRSWCHFKHTIYRSVSSYCHDDMKVICSQKAKKPYLNFGQFAIFFSRKTCEKTLNN